MSSHGQQLHAIQAVADIFARGYLRLTESGKYSAVSEPLDRHKELDVSATESPHAVDQNNDGRCK